MYVGKYVQPLHQRHFTEELSNRKKTFGKSAESLLYVGSVVNELSEDTSCIKSKGVLHYLSRRVVSDRRQQMELLLIFVARHHAAS
jgi:hypothetical protein